MWVDRTYGNADVFLYDAATRVVSRLTTDVADQSDPAISGDIVVWSDKRSGKGTIRALDLSTGTEREVSPGVSDQVRPSVSGTWVVSEDYRNSYNPGIYGRDLAGGFERRIASGLGTAMRRPKLSGTLVVWEDYTTASGAGDIKSYDLATGVTSVVANSGASELLPATDGRWVVWAQAAADGMDVMAYDTATGTRKTVTGQRGEQTFPGVADGVAYWTDNSGGSRLHADTYAFSTRSTARFDDAGTEDITGLAIRDGSAAWLQRRGAGWQLAARVDASLGRRLVGATFGRLWRRRSSAIRIAATAVAPMPLVVASTSVAEGQRRVDPKARLRVKFSRGLDTSKANVAHVYLVDEPRGRKIPARATYDRRSASVEVVPVGRLAEGLYSIVVDDRILDSAGGQIASGAKVTFSTVRTLAEVGPPSVPGKVVARVDTPAQVTLTWNPSVDDVGVTGYDVYRSIAPNQMSDYSTEGSLVASVNTTAVTVPVKSDEASVSFTYNYVVVAKDASGKRTVSKNALPDPHGVNSR